MITEIGGRHGLIPQGLSAGLRGGRQDHRGELLQVSDGAAAVLLMTRGKADALGLEARARIYDIATVGVDPVIMLTGPIPATRRLLERNGMTIDDIDPVEINEAFASVVAAWRRELGPDMEMGLGTMCCGGGLGTGTPIQRV